jgi:hypothetical protein
MASQYSIPSCRNLLCAIGELHKAGYQLIRVAPYLSDSAGGGRWFCSIVPAESISKDHGARLVDERLHHQNEALGYAFYPGGRLLRVVDPDVPPQETAEKILELYPRLAEQGRGRDELYARWYSDMLHLTEPEGLIIAGHWGDVLEPPPDEGLRVVGGSSRVRKLPAPPVRPVGPDG